MADSTISGLTAAVSLVGTEPFPIDQSGATVKATANQIKSFVNALPLLIGSQANTTKYPTALEILSDVTTSDIENHMIGFASERTATFATNGTTPLTGWGIGIYGKGWTNGAARSGGVVGEGMVTLASDTGSAVGVRGYSSQTHSGGMNIGVYGNATGGLTNFDFYSLNGTITSATGALTNTGDLVTTGKLTVGSVAASSSFLFAPLTISSAYGAIYSSGVTPSGLNYSFASSSGDTRVNGTAGSGLYVSNNSIVSASSTGAAVTGTLSSTGKSTSAGSDYTTTASLVPGGIAKHAVTGLTMQGTAGSVYDWAVYTPGNIAALYNPTGTSSIGLSGSLQVNAGTSAANAIQFGGSATTGFYSTGVGTIRSPSQIISDAGFTGSHNSYGYYQINGNKFVNASAPTIASGFGTTPSIVANGTAAFKVTVGTGGAASGVLTFPVATTGWAVYCTDVTNRATVVAVAVSTSTTSVTVEAYSRTTGLASTFAAGDVLEFSALGY